MITRFFKVDNDIYRGSAPDINDLKHLQKDYGIKKIISLDEECGKKISRACDLLGINQIIIPLDGTKASLLNLLNRDIGKLLKQGGPTFIHCRHGKDRTGLLVGLYQCQYMGKEPQDVLKEAKKIGFGVGVDPDFKNLYEKIILSCKPKKEDENNADIVSNQRDFSSDNRNSYIDEAHRSTFAPYLDVERQYPFNQVYNPINDQDYTRENYDKPIKEYNNKENIPLVGLYNNEAGVNGFGPTLNPGGFIYD